MSPEAPQLPSTQEIAFSHVTPDGRELWLMNGDGSNPRPLPTGGDSCTEHTWSPDGHRLAMICGAQVYTMDAAGGSRTGWTTGDAWLGGPRWSPDGNLLAFDEGSMHRTVHILDTRTGDQVTIPEDADRPWASDIRPRWAPDGQRLAFVSRRLGGQQIWLVNPDGSGVTRLTAMAEDVVDFEWAPGGERIAVVSMPDLDDTLTVLSVIGADGGGRRQLARELAMPSRPAWSPDGAQILLTEWRGGDVWVVDVEDATLHRLTAGTDTDRAPAWSPDGAWIGFERCNATGCEIYVMTADGGEPVRITAADSVPDAGVAWRPSS